MDLLNVQPSEAIKDGTQPSALQNANLGLRSDDASRGEKLDMKAVQGVSVQKLARARVRSPFADQDRQITGVAADYLAVNGYTLDKGRLFSSRDVETRSEEHTSELQSLRHLVCR